MTDKDGGYTTPFPADANKNGLRVIFLIYDNLKMIKP